MPVRTRPTEHGRDHLTRCGGLAETTPRRGAGRLRLPLMRTCSALAAPLRALAASRGVVGAGEMPPARRVRRPSKGRRRRKRLLAKSAARPDGRRVSTARRLKPARPFARRRFGAPLPLRRLAGSPLNVASAAADEARREMRRPDASFVSARGRGRAAARSCNTPSRGRRGRCRRTDELVLFGSGRAPCPWRLASLAVSTGSSWSAARSASVAVRVCTR
mmetsp:Transcript_24851/g.83494  ORF Transcript_24851/g.83494 Transcript_24851/m.83494 type:complete len:219 (+) Transcript_24851:200-856(+)